MRTTFLRRMSATSRLSVGERSTAVVLYRALHRIGLAFDRDRALLSLLTLPAHRVFDDEEGWLPVDTPSQRGLSAVAREFLGGGTQFRPNSSECGEGTSLASFIRAEFERPVCTDSASPSSAAERLDTAFAALSFLSECHAAGTELPRFNPKSPTSWRLPSPPAELDPVSSLSEVGVGTLLLGHPAEVSPSFGRSVMILLAHSSGTGHGRAAAESSEVVSGAGDGWQEGGEAAAWHVKGSAALVLNKPSPLPLSAAAQMLRSLDSANAPPTRLGPLASIPVHVGGPVPAPLIAIHRFDSCAPNRMVENAGAGDTGVAAEGCSDRVERLADGPPSLEAVMASAARVEAALKAVRAAEHAGVELRPTANSESQFWASQYAACVSAGLAAAGLRLFASPIDSHFVSSASALIEAGEATRADFKVVSGVAHWGAGQLQGEWEDCVWLGAESVAGQTEQLVMQLVAADERAEEAAAEAVAAVEELSATIQHARTESAQFEGAELRDVAWSGSEMETAGAATERGGARLDYGGGGRGEDEELAEEEAWADIYQRMFDAPLVMLHELLDAELVPDGGQRVWGASLSSMRGAYADFATLARCQEDQCAALILAEHKSHDFEQE